MDLFNTRLALPTMCRTSSALLQSRLHGSPIRRSGQVKLLPRMTCMDGFSLSVQAARSTAASRNDAMAPTRMSSVPVRPNLFRR